MVGLLARVVIGVVEIYAFNKIITKELAKRKIKEEIKEVDKFKEYFKAVVKSKKEKSVSFTVLDKWDEPLGDIDVCGIKVSTDMLIGDEILLKEVC